MKCYEFKDESGVNFGIISECMAKACLFAESMEENCDEFKVRMIPPLESKSRKMIDEDTGFEQSIHEWVESRSGIPGSYMLWHSEAR
jgi:hypothetical protein